MMEKKIDRGEQFSVIMMDIDHFKQYNSDHTHAGADELLKNLGQFLLDRVDRDHFAFRWGGEEFLVVMPGSAGLTPTPCNPVRIP